METWDMLGVIEAFPHSMLPILDEPMPIEKETIPKDILAKIINQKITNKYIIKKLHEFCVLERYDQNYFLVYTIKSSDLDKIEYSGVSTNVHSTTKKESINYYNSNIEKLFKYWREDIDYSSSIHDDKVLNMVSPGDSNELKKNKRTIQSHHLNSTNEDPKDYLDRKYYESLYYLKNPLAYFVKSNLVRFKNMCKSKYKDEFMANYQNTLLDFLLSIPDFDKRFANEHILTSDDVLRGIHDFELRNILREEYAILPEKETSNMKIMINNILVIVKAREIKLQIILLLEIIHNNHLDNNFVDFEKKYKGKLKMRSRNLTRKSRIGRQRRTLKKKDAEQKTRLELKGNNIPSLSIDYCEQLDIYLDKLSILEILLEAQLSTDIITDEEENTRTKIHEYQKNMLNKRQESSSLGFISYVLIPYFNKVIPHTIKFIIKKFKGPSLRTRKATEQNLPEAALQNSEEFNPQQTSSQAASISRKSSVVSSTSYATNSTRISRPTLSRPLTIDNMLQMDKTTSRLGEFLEAESQLSRSTSLLSRTQSDLVMNNLQKRQLPISKFDSNAKRKKSTANMNPGLTRESINMNNSFQRVGKHKAQISTRFKKKSSFYGEPSTAFGDKSTSHLKSKKVLEIMATPLKPATFSSKIGDKGVSTIIESPAIVLSHEDNEEIVYSPSLPNNRIGSIKKKSMVEVEATPRALHSKSIKRSPLHMVIESPQIPETPGSQLTEDLEKVQKEHDNKNVRRRLFAP